MAYTPDPGGHFASDVHRRVLAHLSHPDDNYGWTPRALLERMRPDVGTNIDEEEELRSVLGELEADGHARQHPGEVWQQTEDGAKLLNGPIANEPGPDATPIAPAAVFAATPIGNGTSESAASETPEPEEGSE